MNNAIHVGDQLISIHGQVVETAKMAHKLIKHCEDEEKLTFVIRRMPHGKVFAIRRLVDGEDLGIYCNGGTAEIVTVHPEGLAGQHGLTSKGPSASGDDFCNWVLTEINNRPLNLFFKDNEIEHRLNAVGRDISIVVQPMDFVTELKRSLKATYKNYKDFLVQ
uniref:PDZ domain-containing protein n=1 Tax=Capitella teleta TaxID=283909 RepID=X1YYF1_CAPTE